MKKIVLLILIAVALFLSSCGSQNMNFRNNDGFSGKSTNIRH